MRAFEGQDGVRGRGQGIAETRIRAILYVRVSTDEQVEHGFSIPEQKRDLFAHAKREGWSIVDVIVDEGQSGAVGIRPGLDRIMALADAGAINVVLAKKRNRLFRDRYIRMGYERALKERGVRLMALDDTGHRVADAMMDEFADWFREEVRQNTSAGRMQKAREGKLIGSHTPIFGFRFVRNAHGTIVGYEVDEENMLIVRTVIAAVAEKGTVNGARVMLERANVPAPRGGFAWSITTIRRTVLNDAYRPHAYAELRPMLDAASSTAPVDEGQEYGVVWYPKLKTTRLNPDPARGYARPRTDEAYPREAQVPIPVVSSGIPAELIDAARAAIRGNVAFRNTGTRVYELASIIRCADCGNRMSTNRQGSNGKTYHYYRCSNAQRHGARVCRMNKNYPADVLERMVLNAVLDAVKDRRALIRKTRERFERESGALLRTGADAASWERRLDALERRRMEYIRHAVSGRLNDAQLDALISEIDREKDYVERMRDEHEDRERKLSELEAARDEAIGHIKRGEWGQLGITVPDARRERYREIGLKAEAAVDGTVSLSWGLGSDTMHVRNMPYLTR